MSIDLSFVMRHFCYVASMSNSNNVRLNQFRYTRTVIPSIVQGARCRPILRVSAFLRWFMGYWWILVLFCIHFDYVGNLWVNRRISGNFTFLMVYGNYSGHGLKLQTLTLSWWRYAHWFSGWKHWMNFAQCLLNLILSTWDVSIVG